MRALRTALSLFQLRSATMTTRDEFESAYAALATELVDELSSFEMPPHAVRWVDTVCTVRSDMKAVW